MNMNEVVLRDPRVGDFDAERGRGGVDFLRVVRRHLRLLIGTITLFITLAVVVLLVIPPRYQSTVVLQVDTDDIDLPDSVATAQSVRDLELRRAHQIETQVQLLSSRPVARQVVRDLALNDDPEFNPIVATDAGTARPVKPSTQAKVAPTQGAAKSKVVSPQVIERVTDRLISTLHIQQDGQTSFINVTATSTSPEKAARIANKIAATYSAFQVTERGAALRRNAETLGRQVTELRQDLAATELSIAAYHKAHNIDPGAGSDANSAQMSRLASELAATRAMRAEAATRAVGSARAQTSPLLIQLSGQESTVNQHLAQLTTLYGNAHPDVQKARAELIEVRLAIAREQSRLQSQFVNEAAAQQSREAILASDLGAMRGQSLERGVASVPLADLQRNVTASQGVYVALLSRLRQTIRQIGFVKADATVASPALPPTQPSFPRAGTILGAALAASVIFGLIIVLFSEAMDNEVRTADQIAALTGLPTFGMIPELAVRRQKSAHVTVISQPYSVFAEAVRTVEARLSRHLPRASGNIVVVTSPLPGDGKTTVALGLAAAAIATLRTAIVVELDLRRPGLAELSGFEPGEKDLFDYLQGNATIDDIIVSNPSQPALKAIVVQRSARDPGAALAAPEIATLLDELRLRFDEIIISTPPILAVGDARLIARHADAVLLVVRWGKTTPDLVRSALAQFDGEVTGVVFSRVSYAKHARLAFGDGLQHYRKFEVYYQAPAPKRVWQRLGLGHAA